MPIFIDTSHILALINTGDEHHKQARTVAMQVQGPFVTTEAVLTKVGNALARLRWRPLGISVLEDLRSDPQIDVVPVSSELFEQAVHLYTSRLDKEWSLTDCISFVLMQDRRVTSALTVDRHFRQAGFRALLLEEMSG